MGDRDRAMARRVEAARARIEVEEAGLFHALGRAGASLTKFTDALHPRNHGKFTKSFRAKPAPAAKPAAMTAQEHVDHVTAARKAHGASFSQRMTRKPPTDETNGTAKALHGALTGAFDELSRSGVRPGPGAKAAITKYVSHGNQLAPKEHHDLSVADVYEHHARANGKRTPLSDHYDKTETSGPYSHEHHMEERGVVPVGASPARSEIRGTPPDPGPRNYGPFAVPSEAEQRAKQNAAHERFVADKKRRASARPAAAARPGTPAEAQAAGTFMKHGLGPNGVVGFHTDKHSIEEHEGRAMVYEKVGRARDRHIGDVPMAHPSMTTEQKAGWYQAHVGELTKRRPK